MTIQLLTKSEKLLQEQSRAREKVIALNKKDELTAEERTEQSTLVDRLEAIEPEIRGATTAEAAERAELEVEAKKQAPGEGLDVETRERNDIAKKAKLGTYIMAAISGRRVEGPEAELRAALNMGDDIPMACMDVEHREEHRAITPAPGTVGLNMGMVQPFIFAPSIASRLGIEIRDVPTGSYSIPTITTAPSTAAPKAKGAAADATAGALTVANATPKRVPARLTLALEDVAAVGTESFEEGLRQALQGQLSNSLDNQIINGSGSGANLDGLINQLGNPTAPAANAETYERWIAIAASVIDGLWATMLGEVSAVWPEDAYRQAATQFRTGAGDMTAADYLAEKTASFFCNSRMPAPASNIATGIAARMGQPGITRAVVPSWGRITVDDIYSDSGLGQRHLTVSAIVGDLLLVQEDAYVQLAARIA